MKTSSTSLATRISDLLRERGANQVDLARAIDRSQPFISQFLAGKRGIAIELLGDIATYFECEIADLFPRRDQGDTITPSADERDLVLFFRQAHPQVRHAILAMLRVPADHPIHASLPDPPTQPQISTEEQVFLDHVRSLEPRMRANAVVMIESLVKAEQREAEHERARVS